MRRRQPSSAEYTSTLGLVVINRSAHAESRFWSIKSPCRWNTDPCSNPAPILCTLTTHTSAPASIAQVGKASWKGRCAPQASSTINGFPRSWHTCAIAARSVHVPYGLGLTTNAPAASGYSSHVSL